MYTIDNTRDRASDRERERYVAHWWMTWSNIDLCQVNGWTSIYLDWINYCDFGLMHKKLIQELSFDDLQWNLTKYLCLQFNFMLSYQKHVI